MYIQQFFDALEKRMLFHQRAETLQGYSLHSDTPGTATEPVIDGRLLIVSLTTYDKRLYDVYLTIESIMQQTVKPNKIILWLAENMKDVEIPITLQRQQQRGLEIRYTKDIRSYKKLIPTLKEFPNDFIITIDDDVLYNHDMIELFLSEYRKEPHCIHCGWASQLALDANGQLDRKWEKDPIKEVEISMRNLPVGCAGVLYPPHCFAKEVMAEEVFMSICKYADDVWFKSMTLKNGYPCKAVRSDIHNYRFIDNPGCVHKGLTLINGEQNSVQIKAVFDKYELNTLII